MMRKSSSDETINLILDVAYDLFMEKGYDSTCVQDIIDYLETFHKKEEDAIYHYFKSKEDILIAITDRATSMPLAV